MTRRPHAPRRGGFATITMLFTTALVGMSVVAISALFNLEARQTRQGEEEAQLRQMLLAGGEVTMHWFNDPGGRGAPQFDVPLPAALRARGASLRLTVIPGPDTNHRLVRVDATLGQHAAAQVLNLAENDRKWRVMNARLTRAF